MSWEDPNQFASWDSLTLGTHTFPGIARAGGECMRALEVQKANASDGAPLKDNGYVPVPIDITIRYLSKDHKTIKGIIDAIHPRARGKDRAPLAVTLEQINFMGVTQIYIKSIGFPQISKGQATLTIKCIEYIKDKPKPPKRAPVSARIVPVLPPLFDPFAPSGIEAIEAGFASSEGFL